VPKSDVQLDLKPTSLVFTGTSGTLKRTYHVELEFFAEVDPAESKTAHTARDVAFVLRKKEAKEEYWPRLTKDKAKLHFLKTDFDRWVDEDEQEGQADEDLMAGMGGMPGMGGDGGFGGIDFSKLGGAGGMPDMSAMMSQMGGMPNLGDMGEDEDGDEDDDDEMPALEGEAEKPAAASAKTADAPAAAKITEVVE